MADTSPNVHGAARVVVALTFLLVIAGGLVTSRDAGLAVPDWPLSFGTINPPRWYAIENVRTEHGHRLIAGTVALSTLALAWLVRRRESRASVRRLAAVAAGLVLLQAALGGLRVLHLSVDLAMVHAWLGQIFFTVVVALATVTSPHWRRPPCRLSDVALRRVALLGALIVAQLVIGIVLRHEGAAARPLMSNAVFYLHAAFAVLALALAVNVHACVAAADAYLSRRSRALSALIAVQIALGLSTFAVTEKMHYDRQATLLESWLPTLHVAIGAAVLGLTVTLLLHTARNREAVWTTVGRSAADTTTA
jgi:cytochrome c oxidase assembly protein subunit 15